MARLQSTRALVVITFLALLAVPAQTPQPASAVAASRPTVSAVLPTSVPTAGGIRVRIQGTGFKYVRKVVIGGRPATSVKVVSSRRIWVTVPRHTAGWHSVRVATRAGTSIMTRVARVRYVAPPPPPPPPPAAPAAPVTDLVAEPGETSVQLDWTLPGSNLTSQSVRRITGPLAPRTTTEGALVATLGPGVRTYTDSGLADDTEYSYAVFGHLSTSSSTPRTTSVRTLLTMPAGWERPRPILRPTLPRITDCLAPRHCVAVDALGNTSEYDGTSWSTPAKIDTSIDDPARKGFRLLDCASTTFCLAIDSTVGSRTFNGATWEGRIPVDADAGGPQQLSCGSPTFCVLVTSQAKAYVFNGEVWSPGAPLPDFGDTYYPLEALDCTPAHCALIDSHGRAFHFNGVTWTPPVQAVSPTAGSAQVSCVAAWFCMAYDGSETPRVWNGSVWSDAPKLPWPDDREQRELHCVSAYYCVLSFDRTFIYNGAAWIAWNGETSIREFSCDPTSAYCLIPAHHGDADRWMGLLDGTHGTTAVYRTRDKFEALSCADVTYCQGVDRDHTAVEFRDGSWGEPIDFPHADGSYLAMNNNTAGSADALDCPTATRCIAVGLPSWGGAGWAEFGGTTWDRTKPVEGHLGAGLSAVSCPSPTHCVAVDLDGGNGSAVTTWNGTTWSPFVTISPSAAYGTSTLRGLSCPTTTFCVAVGNEMATFLSGHAVVKDPLLGWTAPKHLTAGHYLLGVSCTVTRFCVAVGSAGVTVAYDAGTWSAPLVLDPNRDFLGVSCASESLCVAVTDDSRAYVRRADGWSAPQVISPGNQLTGVSCPSQELCVVVDSAGNEIRYTGG